MRLFKKTGLGFPKIQGYPAKGCIGLYRFVWDLRIGVYSFPKLRVSFKGLDSLI